MALFPSNPSNGSTANVNGYQFTFDSTTNTWNRTQSFTGSLAVNTLNATSNANVGNIGTQGIITAAGNITGQYILGNGSLLTGVSVGSGSNMSNGTSNLTIATSGGNVTTSVAGNANILVITGTGANINGTLSVSGNANVGNIGGAEGVLSGNLTVGAGSGGSLVGANLVSANYVTGTLITASQPNITSVGTLSSLSVSGNANVGNIGATNGVFTNISGNGSQLSSITGANVSGTVANATYATSAGSATTATSATTAGTVTTASQPNITSVGTLSSLSATGNITGQYILGNGSLLTGIITSVASMSNGTSNVTIATSGGNVTTSVNGNSNIFVVTDTGANVNGTLSVSGNTTVGNGTIQGNLAMGSGTGGSLTGANLLSANYITGTLTTGSQPNITSIGTLSTLSATGNANTGNLNTTGVFATTISSTGNANVGNIGATTAIITTGNITTINSGLLQNGNSNITITANGNVSYYITGNATARMVYTSTGANLAGTFSASGNANVGNIGAATAVITTGNITTINSGLLQNGNSNIVITAAGNLTFTARTVSTLVVSNTGANISGTLSASGNANVGNIGATNIVGTLTTASQPNITSVGTLSSLSVSGNSNVGNLGTAGLITATGNITGQYIIGNGSLLTGITATPSSNLSNGTSNVSITTSGGNVTTSVGGVSNVVVVTSTGANITGTFSVSGNSNVGNIGATNGVFTNLSGNGAAITAVNGANVTGTVPVASIVTGSAQSSITSLGTLTGLSSNNGINIYYVANNTYSTGFNVNKRGTTGDSNAAITAGTELGYNAFYGWDGTTYGRAAYNYVRATENWSDTNKGANYAIAVTATGSNVPAIKFTIEQNGNLIAPGNLSLTGNSNVGNLGTAGLITATGNITGGNIITGGIVTATGNGTFGNVTATLHVGNLSGTGNSNVGNLGVTGIITSTGNITGGNIIGTLHVGNLSGTGNSNVGNLGVTGIITSTGNITGGNLITTGSVNSINTFGYKNRLINGSMRIDQRNSGASVSAAPTGINVYSVDRWCAAVSQASKFTMQQNAGSVTTPNGFPNYLGVTSSSAYSVLSTDYFLIGQMIEGYNMSDLAWGTAGAKSTTLSFLVYSSLTGTFGGSLTNSAQDRSYPFTYSIGSANTWTTISVTIPGDTGGTWLTTSGIGIKLWLGLGVGSTYSGSATGAWQAATYLSATGATSVVGTNAATFYVTGVQFEVGSQATSFDHRSYGTELALCQRYYQFFTDLLTQGYNSTGGLIYSDFVFPVTMRTTPSVTIGTPTYFNASGLVLNTAYNFAFRTSLTITTTGYGGAYNARFSASAEL